MDTLQRLEYYRRRYTEAQPGWLPATAFYEAQVAAYLEAHPPQQRRMLDVGCGRGGIVERLHAAGQWCGCDPDLLSLQEHRQPDLRRALAGAERLPFAAESFDGVVASWVLEHLPAPDLTFAEIARVLRPGGQFFFLTPNARHPIPRLSRRLAWLSQGQQWIVKRIYGRAPADTFRVYYRANTPQAIEQQAVAAGLRLARLALIEDPSYWAWNARSFQLAVWGEMLLPPLWKVHLVGAIIKPQNK